MKALLVVVVVFFACGYVLPAADMPDDGGFSARSSGATASDVPASGDVFSHALSRGEPSTLALPDRGPDRSGPDLQGTDRESAGQKETNLRRFEIVFFTSLPASVLLSLLGVIAFRSAAGNAGSFSAVEYRYLALSTIGISLGLAASDLAKSGGGKIRDETNLRGHR